MIELIAVIQILLLSVFGLFAGYLVLLSILALMEKKSKEKPTSVDEQHRFAIVVPAYNEESGIARTVRDLIDIEYPKDLFDVIVIADNCTDQTARIARYEGAIAWRRFQPDKRGKGYALRWCFDRLLSDEQYAEYDSIVVVDADTRVNKNLLQVFNKYRAMGADVIQGYFSIAPKPDSWTSETTRIGFTLYNYVRPMGRKRLGCTAGLRGNGMCFSAAILKAVSWDAFSNTEDLEYAMSLLQHDVKVVFAPDVIGYNQIPETADKAESQRERWEIGRFPVLKRFAGKLLKSGLRKRSFHHFDAFLDLVTPPLVTMLLFVLLMGGLSVVSWWAGVTDTLLFAGLWLVLFGMGIAHAVIGLIAAGADKAMYKSLLYVPRYAFWKLYLYVKVFLRGRSSEWVRTTRE